MRSLLLPLLGATAFQGCVYYNYDGNGRCDGGCFDFDDIWDGDDDDLGDRGDFEAGLAFYPEIATAGDTLIGYVTADVDLAGAVAVDLFGPVTVHAAEARSNEVLVSFSVAHDAPAASVDLLVTFEDGATAWLPDALTIVRPGSGDDGTPPGEEPCPD